MVSKRDNTGPEENQWPWLGFGKFVLLMLMVAMFFLLGQSMVQHHFFTGGELNNRDAAIGP